MTGLVVALIGIVGTTGLICGHGMWPTWRDGKPARTAQHDTPTP